MAALYKTVNVSTTPVLVAAANNRRKGLIVNNPLGQLVFWGNDANVTTANGMFLRINSDLIFSSLPEVYKGNLYMVVTSGTVTLRVFEWSE